MVVSREVTLEMLSRLPPELHDVLRQHMSRKQQVELFGDYKAYYNDGVMWCHDRYKNGKRHGICNYYFPNGSPMYSHSYKRGKQHGPCKHFQDDGAIYYEHQYRKGKRKPNSEKKFYRVWAHPSVMWFRHNGGRVLEVIKKPNSVYLRLLLLLRQCARTGPHRAGLQGVGTPRQVFLPGLARQ